MISNNLANVVDRSKTENQQFEKLISKDNFKSLPYCIILNELFP